MLYADFETIKTFLGIAVVLLTIIGLLLAGSGAYDDIKENRRRKDDFENAVNDALNITNN